MFYSDISVNNIDDIESEIDGCPGLGDTGRLNSRVSQKAHVS